MLYIMLLIITYLFNRKQDIIVIEVISMRDKILIRKKGLQGEDGYKVFSVRVKEETADQLNKIAADANRSRNEIVNILLDYGINNCEITDKNQLRG